MTCNVHRSALDVSAFGRVVAEVRPDVIAVQEWTSAHGTAFLGEGQWFTQRDGELCLFSRFPIRQVEDVAARAWAARREPGAAVVYELAAPPGPVPLVNLHLASPHKAFDAVLHWTGDGPEMIDRNVALRRRQSQEIRRAIERFGAARALLAGDFNTPGESDIFRESWSRYADAFAIAGAGLGDTYYARWTQVRIDHVLAGAGWRCRRAEVGPDVGSPHRPLIVELEWAGLIQR
jgi:endonuclease/exonuclease/phosphatase family metal-dependent hydrolase